MAGLIGGLLAVLFIVGYIVLKVVLSAGVSWVIVTVFGWIANLVGVDIYSAYDKGTVVLVMAVIVLIISMFNSKKD